VTDIKTLDAKFGQVFGVTGQAQGLSKQLGAGFCPPLLLRPPHQGKPGIVFCQPQPVTTLALRCMEHTHPFGLPCRQPV